MFREQSSIFPDLSLRRRKEGRRIHEKCKELLKDGFSTREKRIERIFWKYVTTIHDGRCIVSRGIARMPSHDIEEIFIRCKR